MAATQRTQRSTTTRSRASTAASRRGPSSASGARPKTNATAATRNRATTSDKDAEPRLVGRLGPVEVDLPRSLGYFGGVALAVTAGLIDPPLGLFIAAVPIIKMADLPKLPNLPRFVAQVFEGVAKPVGGDSEGTLRLVSAKGSSDSPVASD